MNYPSLGISIRKTPIGRGVFATKAFRKDQPIGEMRGVVIVTDEYDPAYVVGITGGVLEPAAPFRFLNHRCEPNAELIEDPPTRTRAACIWVVATRSIRRGEQITIDYAWPAEEEAIRCMCGAPKCRGWVVAATHVRRMQRLEKQLAARREEEAHFAAAAE